MARRIQIKKVGDLYYRCAMTTSKKEVADRMAQDIRPISYKVIIEKKSKRYLVWYAPSDIEWQTLAKWEWEKRHKGKK